MSEDERIKNEEEIVIDTRIIEPESEDAIVEELTEDEQAAQGGDADRPSLSARDQPSYAGPGIHRGYTTTTRAAHSSFRANALSAKKRMTSCKDQSRRSQTQRSNFLKQIILPSQNWRPSFVRKAVSILKEQPRSFQNLQILQLSNKESLRHDKTDDIASSEFTEQQNSTSKSTKNNIFISPANEFSVAPVVGNSGSKIDPSEFISSNFTSQLQAAYLKTSEFFGLGIYQPKFDLNCYSVTGLVENEPV